MAERGPGRRAHERIAGYFMAVHAITVEDAAAYSPQGDADRAEFDRMRARGIVREAIPGHYWIDRAAYRADRIAADRRLGTIAGLVAVLLAVAIMLLYFV